MRREMPFPSIITNQGRQLRACIQINQRVVEIESEEPRIFSYHRSRRYIEDIVIGLLRDLVTMLGEQLPKVAASRVLWHAAESTGALDSLPSCSTP
jgi:hypothetical protein